MKLNELIANPRNPRKIEKQKLKMLAKSMIEHGPLDGFVFNRRTQRLAGGHQRQKIVPPEAEIVIEKKYSKPTPQGTVATGYVDYLGERWPYREVDWDEQKEKAANIAANKGAGEWDLPKLQEFVVELDASNFDLDLTMFDSDELKDLFGKDFGSDPKKDAIEDDVLEAPKEPRSKLGDLYELGEHRLLCGDSTDRATVERLMNGEKGDMVFTDPPYGMNLDTEYSDSWGKQSNTSGNIGPRTTKNHKKVIGDDKEFDPSFLLDLAKEVLLFGADYFCQSIPKKGSWLVWDKTGGNESLDHTGFQSRFELCWSKVPHRRKIYRSTWIGVAGMSHKDDVNRMHPTQKPVKLCEQMINDIDSKSVIDLFGGSGSTLIACEKTKRKCFMMEIDPHYIDVIVSRYVKYTGNNKIKLNGKPIDWEIT